MAFEVWLRLDDRPASVPGPFSTPSVEDIDPAPRELPILLQVLLHSTTRATALRHLVAFMDLGPPAVHHAIVVGVKPYLMKILSRVLPGAEGAEIKGLLILAWAKIFVHDPGSTKDLLPKDLYTLLPALAADAAIPPEHRGVACLLVAQIAHHNPQARRALSPSAADIAALAGEAAPPVLRRLACLALAEL